MKHVIVIGNGMVGFKFCEKLRGYSPDIAITVYGEEPRPAYDRVNLSKYFSGKTAEDLMMAPLSWYQDNNIQLFTNELVTEIDRVNKKVKTYHGKEDHYDYLVFATGSSAFAASRPRSPPPSTAALFIFLL